MNPFLHEFNLLQEPGLLTRTPGAEPHRTTLSDEPTEAPPPAQAVRIWDLPTRLFHWGLVLAVTVAIATGLVGGNWMALHGQAGLSITGLLVFRLVWGLVGNRQARFRHFVPGPRALQAYLQGRWRGLGHNPLGALSVLALLGLLAAQVGTGLFGNDEIAFTGPLAGLVEDALSLRLTGWHQRLSTALFALLGLHVTAIAAHRWLKRDDLLTPMISGIKKVQDPVLAAEAHSQLERSPLTRSLSLSLALCSAAAAVYLASGGMLLLVRTNSAEGSQSAGNTTQPLSASSAAPAASAAALAPAW